MIVFERDFSDSGGFWPGWTEDGWEQKLNGNFIVIDIFDRNLKTPMLANFLLQI